MQKPGRNDPCPCGSGKKFKKCCESRKHKPIQAALLPGEGSKMHSLFQKKITVLSSPEKEAEEDTNATTA